MIKISFYITIMLLFFSANAFSFNGMGFYSGGGRANNGNFVEWQNEGSGNFIAIGSIDLPSLGNYNVGGTSIDANSDGKIDSGFLGVLSNEYVSTPPTYSDEACTPGQYSLTEQYRFDCVSSGNWNRTSITEWVNPSPLVSSFIGWSNTDGTPTGNPSLTYGGVDVILTRQWQATENGTITSVNVYIAQVFGTVAYDAVVVYKDIAGTITLIGQGDITASGGAWTGEITIVVESGQTLDFNPNDVLYFGVVGATNDTFTIGREATGGNGLYYVSGGNYDSGPPATVTFTNIADYDVGAILGYQ